MSWFRHAVPGCGSGSTQASPSLMNIRGATYMATTGCAILQHLHFEVAVPDRQAPIDLTSGAERDLTEYTGSAAANLPGPHRASRSAPHDRMCMRDPRSARPAERSVS